MRIAPPAPDAIHYLPDLLPGEHELARVTIHAGFATGTYSVRTRRDPATSVWRHRLVDEHANPWRIRPARTLRPLGAAQLQGLIDSATCGRGPFDGRDFIGAVWAALRLDEVPAAVSVQSDRFPELARHYADRESRYLHAWGA